MNIVLVSAMLCAGLVLRGTGSSAEPGIGFDAGAVDAGVDPLRRLLRVRLRRMDGEEPGFPRTARASTRASRSSASATPLVIRTILEQAGPLRPRPPPAAEADR